MASITRKASAVAGNVGAITLVNWDVFRANPRGKLLCAVQDANAHLELIDWHVDADGGAITRKRAAGAGRVSEVALTFVHDHPITAVRDERGHLKVISFDSKLERRDDAGGGAASSIAVASLAYNAETNLFVTGLRDAGGNLKLIAWSVASDGSLSRKGEASAGPVQAVRIARVDGALTHQLVTPVITAAGMLKVIAWSVSEDGMTFTRRHEAEAGAASELSVTYIGALVFTSFRNGDGNLEVIVWGCSAVGEVFRHASKTAGKVNAVAATWTQPGLETIRCTTAVCNEHGNLQLISWDFVATPPVSLERVADATAGSVCSVAADMAWATDGKKPIIVSAVKNDAGNLELIAWELH